MARIVEKNEGGVYVQKQGEAGELRLLPFDVVERFGVFEESAISLSVGDVVRVTRNAKSLAGKKLFNSNIHRVTSVQDGEILTLDGKHEISAREGLLDWGYCTTSQSSQGKAADKVLISQSGLS